MTAAPKARISTTVEAFTPLRTTTYTPAATAATSTTRCTRVISTVTSAPRRGAVDAEACCGHGLQPGRVDAIAAPLAHAVGAGLQLGQGGLDVGQRLLELVGQHFGLAPLGRDLAGVGE